MFLKIIKKTFEKWALEGCLAASLCGTGCVLEDAARPSANEPAVKYTVKFAKASEDQKMTPEAKAALEAMAEIAGLPEDSKIACYSDLVELNSSEYPSAVESPYTDFTSFGWSIVDGKGRLCGNIRRVFPSWRLENSEQFKGCIDAADQNPRDPRIQIPSRLFGIIEDNWKTACKSFKSGTTFIVYKNG